MTTATVSRVNNYAVAESTETLDKGRVRRINTYLVVMEPTEPLDKVRVTYQNSYAASTDKTLLRAMVQPNEALKPTYVTGTNPYLDTTSGDTLTLRNLDYTGPVSLIYMDEAGTSEIDSRSTLARDFVVSGKKVNQLVVVRNPSRVLQRALIKQMERNRSTVTLLPPRP